VTQNTRAQTPGNNIIVLNLKYSWHINSSSRESIIIIIIIIIIMIMFTPTQPKGKEAKKQVEYSTLHK